MDPQSMTGERLDSWKEIAAYLKRSVRTVTRWEREEGLPVHRHLHSKSGTVYAYPAELDAWWASRGSQIDRQPAEKPAGGPYSRALMAAVAITAVASLSAIAWVAATRRSPPPAMRLVPLTTYPGIEGAPSLSPDGNQVAFERDGDIFVKQVDGEAFIQLTRTRLREEAPAWSPDGRQIAFTRDAEGVFVISPLGGAERRIADTRVPLLLKAMAWTPDARSLVISERTSPICASLFVVSAATGQKTRLTSPPEPSIGDGWPAISPDGRTVAFARYSQDTSASVYVVPLAGGDARLVSADKVSIFGLAWTGDAELLLSADRNGTSRLWRMPLERAANSELVPLDVAGDGARFPSVSHPGPRRRLAYQHFVENLDIRRAEVVGDGTERRALAPSHPFIASTRSEDHPRYSPDGARIAFVSSRSGTQEIWISASDASNPTRLTSMNGPVVIGPEWSPDGRRIAFFATTGLAGNYAVYVTGAEGGPPARLTLDEKVLEALPAWSQNGRWIYVTSGRSGSLQIWKRPPDGGESIQLTRGGGAEASESLDGRTVYYTKVPEMGPGLWNIPAEGGEEVRILDAVRFGYWALGPHGIYFIDFDVPADAPRPVKFFSFQSREVSQVGVVEKTVAWRNTPGFTVSPDGRWLLYTSLESTDADLVLMEPVR